MFSLESIKEFEVALLQRFEAAAEREEFTPGVAVGVLSEFLRGTEGQRLLVPIVAEYAMKVLAMGTRQICDAFLESVSRGEVSGGV